MTHPDWLDRKEYPFAAHVFGTEFGEMHYVDEGQGAPVVLLHGNPTWSFLYRHAIQHLAPRYRCIAPDYLGFGFSDKPLEFSYRPEDHARLVHRLLDTLDLQDATLVVQDWGGPIGLSYALAHPERVSRLVIMNTWMWPIGDNLAAQLFSRILGSAVGRFVIQQFNFFARVIMPFAFGDKARFPKEIHAHYLHPLDTPPKRKGSWVFPKAILGSEPWLDQLWQQRDRLAGKPALLVWGMKDPAFPPPVLHRWQKLFPAAEVHTRDDVGHYVQEELGRELGELIDDFLSG